VRLRYWFFDQEGTYSDSNIYLDPDEVGGNLNLISQFGDAFGHIIEIISECVLVGYDIILTYLRPVDQYAITTPLYEHGIYIFETTAETRYIVQIASAENSIRDTDNITILTDNSDVVAFMDMMIDGDGTVAPSFEGNEIVHLNKAYIQARPVHYTYVEG
jgi:hypothetical protein